MFDVDPAWIVLATLGGSLFLFLTEALRYDVVALLVVLVLALTGCLEAKEAFMGFSSPAVILIASMYVFGHAFTRSGVAETIGRRFLKGSSEVELVVRVTLVSGLLSSVLSNTGVVATLIPVCSSLARTHRIPASRLLLPMAYGSLLGGLVTVVATSTNIAINQAVVEAGGEPFGLFDFTPLGLVLLAVGAVWFLGPGRLLVRRTQTELSLSERYQVPQFVTEVLVEPSSTMINRAVADIDVFAATGVNVLGIVRAGGESTVLAPGPYNRIRADDTLILQGAPEDIVRLSSKVPLEVRKSVETADTRLYSDDVALVEAVIPAGSSFVGQTLTSSEFRSRTGLNVLGLAKHGEVQLKRLQNTELEIGDTLLVQGHQRDLERARRERDVLVLDEVQAPRLRRHGTVAIALLGAVLLLATVTSIDLAVLGLTGAMGLVLLGVVRVDEVPAAIDWSVIALVGGMLALGHAFHQQHLGESVANWIAGLGDQGLAHHAVLAIVLVGTVLLTQVLNNVSTAVIMTPVALELASTLEIQDRPLLMAVVTGSSLAFMTPVAHQANAMVMGPAELRYFDYVRAGLPLTILTSAVAVVVIPWLWPFV
ncbi:MAG: SLC13 family permease [bacterium]|nr:SLC13 family permease [bacterium]